MMDIAEQKWSHGFLEKKRAGRGQSLFTEISKERSCEEAAIPENHCTCLAPGRKLQRQSEEITRVMELFLEWLKLNARGKGVVC